MMPNVARTDIKMVKAETVLAFSGNGMITRTNNCNCLFLGDIGQTECIFNSLGRKLRVFRKSLHGNWSKMLDSLVIMVGQFQF